MTTLDKLQAHLAAPSTWVSHGYSYKNVSPHVKCADGSTMSVQASWSHYCEPCDNVGPYTKVEVWCCGEVPAWSDFGDGEYPYARVPIELVAEEIDRRGGFE